jgi:hypothetical protein
MITGGGRFANPENSNTNGSGSGSGSGNGNGFDVPFSDSLSYPAGFLAVWVLGHFLSVIVEVFYLFSQFFFPSINDLCSIYSFAREVTYSLVY